MFQKQTLLYILVAGSLFLASCAGGTGYIKANGDELKGPVSITSYIYDSEGRLLEKGRDLDIVGLFTESNSFTSMFYKALPLDSEEWDITPLINEQLDKYNGEAVINFKVEGETPFFLLGYFGALIPFIPNYVSVTIKGEVVKRKVVMPSQP